MGVKEGYVIRAEIMDEMAMNRAIRRIAHEILEKNKGPQKLAIIGIHTRGVPIADRISAQINEIEQCKVATGTLDITFYRDDLSLLAAHPVLNGTKIDFSLEDKHVILVDDVIYTGRTTRAAVEALFECGRPLSVQLAVMIDRGHRELPFRADFVGKNVPTSTHEIISVEIKENDGRDRVTVWGPGQ